MLYLLKHLYIEALTLTISYRTVYMIQVVLTTHCREYSKNLTLFMLIVLHNFYWCVIERASCLSNKIPTNTHSNHIRWKQLSVTTLVQSLNQCNRLSCLFCTKTRSIRNSRNCCRCVNRTERLPSKVLVSRRLQQL